MRCSEHGNYNVIKIRNRLLILTETWQTWQIPCAFIVTPSLFVTNFLNHFNFGKNKWFTCLGLHCLRCLSVNDFWGMKENLFNLCECVIFLITVNCTSLIMTCYIDKTLILSCNFRFSTCTRIRDWLLLHEIIFLGCINYSKMKKKWSVWLFFQGATECRIT